MVLYHKTDAEAARAIMRDGFRDGSGHYMTDAEHAGVWLSDTPMWGAAWSVLFELTFSGPESELSDFEWVEEGKGYRKWLIPAVFVNSRMTFKVIQEG